jgi:hypothetical protein
MVISPNILVRIGGMPYRSLIDLHSPADHKESSLIMNGGNVAIESNGSLLSKEKLETKGCWSWELFSESLQVDYTPDEDKKLVNGEWGDGRERGLVNLDSLPPLLDHRADIIHIVLAHFGMKREYDIVFFYRIHVRQIIASSAKH